MTTHRAQQSQPYHSAWQRSIVSWAATVLPMAEPSETITCPGCGGEAHLLQPPTEEDPYEPGEVAAYRCSDCGDRIDVPVSGDEDEGRPEDDG